MLDGDGGFAAHHHGRWRLLDIYGAVYADGTKIAWNTCNGGNQQWQAANGELVNPYAGKCLDDPRSNTPTGDS